MLDDRIFLYHICLLLIFEIDTFAGKVENVNKVQTLLFSATLPDWVKHVCFYVMISSFCFWDVMISVFNVI